jgi:hypothetical protein
MKTGVSLTAPLVFTSSNGGLNVEQLAEITVGKIIYADEGTVAPEIFRQAMEYRAKIKVVIIEALAKAKRSALLDYINDADSNGLNDLAAALRERLTNGNY